MDHEEESDKLEKTFFCPHCGSEILIDSETSDDCNKIDSGEELLEEIPEREEDEKKKRNFLLWGAGFLLLAVLLVLFRSGEKKKEPLFFYVKDNSLYGTDLKGRKIRVNEYSGKYLENWGAREKGGLLEGRDEKEYEKKTAPVYSRSGRYLFYPEAMLNGNFYLIRKDLRRKETKTLDSDVIEFIPTRDGVIYRKENQSVFFFDGNRKKKIASDLSEYRVNEEGTAVIWISLEEGTKDLYYWDLEGKKEPVRLERNIEFLDCSPSFHSILILKENSVYRFNHREKKEKLVDDVKEVALADAEKNRFYFIREDQRKQSSYQELYYYSSGKKRRLDENFKEFCYQKNGILVYKRTNNEKDCMLSVDGKVKELGRTMILPSQAIRDGERLYFMGTDVEKEQGKLSYELCYVDLRENDFGAVKKIDDGVMELSCVVNKKPYYLKDGSGKTGDLYCDGVIQAYDVAVDSISQVPKDHVLLYLADYSTSRRRGTLLMNQGGKQETIASDISGYSAISKKEIILVPQYNVERERGDLLLYNGRDIKTIDTDVWGYYGIGISRFCR